MLVVWVALLVTELGRGLWTLRHRYASPRWLRSVYAAVGDDVAVHALAELMRQHRYEPNYVILRSDMASAVQQERAKRRDAARRAEGVRLVEEPEAASGSEPRRTVSRISEAQRARACERRAGGAARTANWST
jgi:biopolymer transport protein ExbB/TolQ